MATEPIHRLYVLPLVSIVVLLAASAGCRTTAARQSTAPTQIDRLSLAYPELEGGRLLVIADFEDAKHMELFQLAGASSEGSYALDLKNGRQETGRGCLRFTAGSPSDTIVVNNSAAQQWYLKRDWRPYDLLLLSINSPGRDLAAEIAISGGPAVGRLTTHASISLRRGWNVLRLDLAEIGERVPLDDVQELRLSISGASKPVEVYVDDIILAGSREDLLGDSQNRGKGLYVQRVGRRWRIGAAGPTSDFELTFASGQIVELYNMATDPYRLQNLVRGTTLGPAPTVVSSSDGEQGDFSFFGRAVVARSRIVEMNAVRAVVTCDWRFVDDTEVARGGLDNRPFQRWVYTIYPTGQIYVTVEATAGTPSVPRRELGLAVTLAAMPGDEIETHVSGTDHAAAPETGPAYATVRNKSNDSLLLYAVRDADRKVRITESRLNPSADNGRGSTRRTSLVAAAGAPSTDRDIEAWACHLFVGSASGVSGQEAHARAVDYLAPVPPRLQLGSFASAVRTGVAGNGFDPTSGCHVITPERGHVRLAVDGGRQQRFSPSFQIANPDNQEAWVYVDHLIYDKTARDRDGNLVFQLPGVIAKSVLVEVFFRNPSSPP